MNAIRGNLSLWRGGIESYGINIAKMRCLKNVPPKHIIEHIDIIKVAWLQEPGSFGGHKPRKGGHRMVSGIVRAKVKKAYRKYIDSSLSED